MGQGSEAVYNYVLRLMLYLVYYYVLATQLAPVILPQLNSVIFSKQIDYDVSVFGSMITELFQWTRWFSSFLLQSSIYCVCLWSQSLSDIMSYFYEEKKLVVSRADWRRNARFRFDIIYMYIHRGLIYTVSK